MDIEAIKAKYLVNDVRDPAEWRAKFSRLRNLKNALDIFSRKYPNLDFNITDVT